MNLRELFEQHNDSEYLHSERVCPLSHHSPMLHAFLLLNRLVPGAWGVIANAEHGIIYLDVDSDTLSEVISEEEVIDLIRCGVHLRAGDLCMSV